jgi:hypothetical protein
MATTKRKATVAFKKSEGLPLFLAELFYGDKGSQECRWMRSNAVTGLTRSCYIAQKLFIIRYILIKYYKYDFYLHGILENIIFNITGSSLNYANKYFEDQLPKQKIIDYLKSKPISDECIERLQHLSHLFTSQLTGRAQVFTADQVEAKIKESEETPIPMAFGYNPEMTRNGLYEIDHWFVLYNGRIYGATGLGDVQIAFYGSEKIKPDEFAKFLNVLNGESKQEDKKKIFDAFIREKFAPLSHAIQVNKKRAYGSDMDKERETHIPINVEEEIQLLLDSYTKLTDYKLYILNGYGLDKSYTETMKKAIDCLVPIINENVIGQNVLEQRDEPLSEEEMLDTDNKRGSSSGGRKIKRKTKRRIYKKARKTRKSRKSRKSRKLK